MVAWNKGIKRSNSFWKGKIHSEESKKKMSESAKGRIPCNKGKKGLQVAWNKGKKYGKGRKLPNCIDCDKKLKSPYAKRCVSCFSIFNKGVNHPNWKGGKCSQDYKDRRKFRDTMQKFVFERDNYTCQLCGARGDLQVDHIQSWAEYVELRFSIDNCRTLCAKCHYKITFGRDMPMTVKGWGHNLLRRVDS
jgi:hypothetical protein